MDRTILPAYTNPYIKEESLQFKRGCPGNKRDNTGGYVLHA